MPFIKVHWQLFCHQQRCIVFILMGIYAFQVNAEPAKASILIHAARIFDGFTLRTHSSLLVVGDTIRQIDRRENMQFQASKVIDLGDATLLPGFIELHAHLAFQHIPTDVILKHGITTLRDVGGPVHPPYGGDGRLRVLSSGPIITTPTGYPISVMGADNIALGVSSEQNAREAVQSLVNSGAVIIKIALEPGGEKGAHWSNGAHHMHTKSEKTHQQMLHEKKVWPLLSIPIVKAIVAEAHRLDRKVTAHIGEEKGAKIAIQAGVDEWAHMPCAEISVDLLKKALAQSVKIITTLDSFSQCAGVEKNARKWAALGGEYLYGAEIAHTDTPWGIDAQELIYMLQFSHGQPIDVLRSATSKSGEYLNIPLLGTLQSGAPADLIAVKGDPLQNLKILEYPGFVMSGGKIIVNDFTEGEPLP
ncbi:amidohydrolase family protein [Methylomonas sp. AM2-LC]|uniref:amidohydrolase family protein n=1 Tax=Methylomonas sp. AM2-LC TaxID=3153301 RepID=UPI003262E366